ncbi:hypothetical protein ACFO3U_03275 [Flavobacterium ponti]|uniref:Uncharacterized protein n=1 Tax=Flavobacterium ponti TaxID=665133 RepID=A0ABV9P2Z0_9FLAO
MKFKNHISILLASVVFMANIGYGFTVHFCNDTIASISLNASFEEPCEKPAVSCCATDSKHDSCCSNKIIKVEKKHDNFLNKSLKFETSVATLNTISPIEFTDNAVLFSINENPAFYCESNAPPLYKLYCKLVLYA